MRPSAIPQDDKTRDVVGVCRYCGCTDQTPCVVYVDGYPTYCAWADEDQDLCAAPACIERAYRDAVKAALGVQR